MKYLWTEDTGAGLHFWELVNRLIFDGTLNNSSYGQGLPFYKDVINSLNIKHKIKIYYEKDDLLHIIAKKILF